MEEPKSIDELVAQRQLHQAEIKQLGERIRASGRKAAVVFVDLSESTSIKQGTDPDVWLGLVYAFLRAVERIARERGGTVVKRIGDEVLVTFETIEASEAFIDAVLTDASLGQYRFKVAADSGEVFFFRFEEHLELDPYGSVVDRCARIAKLVVPGSVLCSGAYEAATPPGTYLAAGAFKLVGISEPQEVFVRRGPVVTDQQAYLKPLLDALNSEELRRPRYQWVSRQFSVSDFNVSPLSSARPFLIRELLAVPHLPLSLAQFAEALQSLEHEDERLRYVGYLVEWEGTYRSIRPISGDFLAMFILGPKPRQPDVILKLMPEMTEVLRTLKKGTPLRFRGLITEIDSFGTTLNFVDLALPEEGGPEAVA